MLLSIAIPAYDRPEALHLALDTFIEQISGKYEDDIEIIVADDASPGNSLGFVEDLARQHRFISFKRYEANIGLERNLLTCAADAKGEFLWIFGDDDFLETDDALDDIVRRLRTGKHDMLVLNRTRRSSDLSTLISDNWMRLKPTDQAFPGLRDFCLKFGFISIIGFISVNIFRREAFQAVDAEPYFGTTYPQLGAMLEAFHNRPVELVSRPLVCHRTRTAEEKRAALGNKKSEADFMADENRRNALYFSHPYVAMIDHLIDLGAFSPQDVTKITENTVIAGLLVDFLINCVELSLKYESRFTDNDWTRSKRFFDRLPLSNSQEKRVRRIFGERGLGKSMSSARGDASIPAIQGQLTISVVTPSYNQAEFLDECLQSVRDQSYQPIEHFVFDPGSTDNSRDIARKYAHVTLIEEPDEGQSDALNKGFRLASGDIVAWLNSDDVFADPSVFQTVIDRFNQPDAPDIVYGKGIFIGEDGQYLRDVYVNKDPSSLHWRFQQEDGILQPALFMRRSVIEDVGELTASRHFCMDYEYWIRCVHAGKTFAYVDQNFALARYHSDNKTFGQRGKSYAEVCDMLMSHFGYVNHNWLKRYAEFLSDGFDGVLAHGANSQVADIDSVDRIYRQLLADYNGGVPVYETLEANPSQKGRGDTLREMRSLVISPSTPCKEVPLNTQSEAGKVLYTVGPRRWAFDATWKKAEIKKAHEFLRDRIASRTSDTCVIVGNGPSLRKSNLSLLEDVDVIISNNAFLDERLAELATYYTVVNYLVAEQSAHHINRLKGIPKILPYWTSYCLNGGADTYFIDAVGHPEFSKDLFKNASWRHTVTFYNMHIAFGLGYKRVVLIGFDHSYKQKANVKEGEIVISNERDENHFDSRYFQGKKWQAADVDMMEAMYLLARKAYAEEGRELVNATVGGALEVFPRMTLEDALSMKPIPNDAMTRAMSAQPRMSLAFSRDAGAHVDETQVVAYMLADRKGRQHTMIDVGAHFGSSSQYFDELGWTVHCFEPDPKNREKLEKRHANKPNISIDTRAVSDKPAKGVSFFTSDESTGISGLHAFRDTHSESGKVDITTVAHTIGEKGIEHIDFLKIDVEGFDWNVLKGVPWDRIKPDVIEAEFEDAKTVSMGHTYKDVCDYLVEHGYTVYLSEWHPIVRYGIPHDWRQIIKYPTPLADEDGWGNLLAFKEDPGPQAVQAAFKACLKSRKPEEKPKSTFAQSVVSPEAVLANAPTTHKKPNLGRSNVHKEPAYTRFALWAKDKNPLIFGLGQFAMWSLRTTLRYIGAAFLVGAVFVGLIIASLQPALAEYRIVFWVSLALMVLAGLVVVTIGYMRHVTKKLRFESQALRASELRQLKSEMNQVRQQAKQSVAAEAQAIRSQLEWNISQIEGKLGQLESSVSGIDPELDGMRGHLSDMRSDLSNLGKDLGGFYQKFGGVAEMQERLEAKVATEQERLEANIVDNLGQLRGDLTKVQKKLPPNNATYYQFFSREMNPEDVKTLVNVWGQNLSVPLNEKTIYYMADRAGTVEKTMQGRLATSIENMTLRSVVAMGVKGKDLSILEIGTLFGIGAGIMYDALAGQFNSVKLTLLDPLDGYYDNSSRDILTGQPVTEAVVRRNLSMLGIPNEQVSIIKRLSTDDEASDALKGSQFDVLIIDGDHSKAGVKADFEIYGPLVKRGGFIIFDDYGTNDWPDIKTYVDEEIDPRNDLALVGKGFRSAVYKVIRKIKTDGLP